MGRAEFTAKTIVGRGNGAGEGGRGKGRGSGRGRGVDDCKLNEGEFTRLVALVVYSFLSLKKKKKKKMSFDHGIGGKREDHVRNRRKCREKSVDFCVLDQYEDEETKKGSAVE
ncbi:LOW QUALITY PROTEIN: hypothetical protein PanWU01x14_125160 [Parasponia andersonii]|uniref:Uncharacterized protein n=1 Tax=Parasponia andersonii TaxID=3476 RepID=A0A2P5CTS8_PARAD|nr:LOW QUALITY PROTEIN: hypothetical protein PanWU01x14_125160 [Parasponia andersonii]